MASADPLGRTIRRFTWTERAAHWWLAATVGAMTATGAALYFPAFAQLLDRPTAKHLHLWSAIALPVGWLVLTVLGDRRSLGRTLRDADRFDRDDLAWLKGGPRRIVDRRGEPPQGRLNAGQKLNLALTLGLLGVLGISGTLLWLGERDTAYRYAGSVHVHDLATLALTFLVCGHLYLALFHPATQGALSGVTQGYVDRDWAREHHAKWVAAEEAADVAAAEREMRSGAAEEALEAATPAPLGEEFPER
jgi:formate dehydrogenase subunit gamma